MLLLVGLLLGLLIGVAIGIKLGQNQVIRIGNGSFATIVLPHELFNRLRVVEQRGKSKNFSRLIVYALATFDILWNHHIRGYAIVLRNKNDEELTVELDPQDF